MKLATVLMVGSIALFAFSAADAKDREYRKAEGKARDQRGQAVHDARNRTAVPVRGSSNSRSERSAANQRSERRDERADNVRHERRDQQQGNGHGNGQERRQEHRADHRIDQGRDRDHRGEHRREEGRRDVQRAISDRRDHHDHRREGDIRREQQYRDHRHDDHRHNDHRHTTTTHRHNDYRRYDHHHGHTIVRREHYVRHNLVSVDNFWDGIFLGAIFHVAYHDGMFCRNRYHDHYRTHYYWEDELGYCYRVEPGHRRDHFIEVPQYMCY